MVKETAAFNKNQTSRTDTFPRVEVCKIGRGDRAGTRPLVKYPQEIGDFELCKWDNLEEHDTCQNCGNQPDVMYVRFSSESQTIGDYYCYTCVVEEVELIEDI